MSYLHQCDTCKRTIADDVAYWDLDHFDPNQTPDTCLTDLDFCSLECLKEYVATL